MDASPQTAQLAKLCNVALVAANDNAYAYAMDALGNVSFSIGIGDYSKALCYAHSSLFKVHFLDGQRISDTYAAISDLIGALECVLTPPNAMIPGKPRGVKGT